MISHIFKVPKSSDFPRFSALKQHNDEPGERRAARWHLNLAGKLGKKNFRKEVDWTVLKFISTS